MAINLNAVGRELKDRIQAQLDAEDLIRRGGESREGHTACSEPSSTPGVTDEVEQLHKPIIKWLREHDWPFFYGNPTKRTGRTLGEPDFVVCAPKGIVILVECKTEKGQLTKEQDKLRKRLAVLGHHVWIIRSWSDFADAIARTVL